MYIVARKFCLSLEPLDLLVSWFKMEKFCKFTKVIKFHKIWMKRGKLESFPSYHFLSYSLIELGSLLSFNDICVSFSIRNVVDIGDNYVMMAGLVDTSVHIQDPGRGDWEGFAAVTKAAGVYFD